MNASPKPIAIIGAGGIVEHAHLPAYAKAGFEVVAIADIDQDRAARLAGRYGITQLFGSAAALVREFGNDVIYDIAVPGKYLAEIVKSLPVQAHALLQKPLGENLQQATELKEIVQQKNCCAGVNFQLRYAPAIETARQLIQTGVLGELVDAEVYVDVFTPWHLWDFLFTAERMEILYHSIHYLDLLRSLLGEPQGLFAKTTADPRYPQLKSVRSSMILDYGDQLRATINTNHTHPVGSRYQHSFIRLEGTQGMVRIELGVLMDYPKGKPDKIEFLAYTEGAETGWKELPLNGNWFPDAFIGSMNEIRKATIDPGYQPDNAVNDAWQTMYWVEKAYQQSSLHRKNK